MLTADLPEYNVTGQDYTRRDHLIQPRLPIIDVHAHVTMTSPEDQARGPAGGAGSTGSIEQARLMLETAASYGIVRTYSMCPPQDIAPLRAAFGDQIGFNGMITKKADEPEDAAYRLLDQFLEAGIEMVKLWAAPRGRERGLVLDAPWRIEALHRARQAGIRVVMCHVGDPDRWWQHTYQDTAKFGTKPEQYLPLERMLDLFGDMQWIGAHMGGNPENPDSLAAMLERHPNLHFDTSATKWQVREVSKRARAFRDLISHYPERFLFGSDLVTRHMLVKEHYESRYWCQFTLWESTWEGSSPIADPDFDAGEAGVPLPILRGLNLPQSILEQLYSGNLRRLLGR